MTLVRWGGKGLACASATALFALVRLWLKGVMLMQYRSDDAVALQSLRVRLRLRRTTNPFCHIQAIYLPRESTARQSSSVRYLSQVQPLTQNSPTQPMTSLHMQSKLGRSARTRYPPVVREPVSVMLIMLRVLVAGCCRWTRSRRDGYDE